MAGVGIDLGLCGANDPDKAKFAHVIGGVLLVVCLAVVALYIVGYKRPPNHPLPVSIAAIASTSLEYLSLAIWPIVADHCRPAGLIVALLIAATLARLCWVGWRQPVERARAFAMIAVLLAMIGAALAVGISRSFIGGRAGRYVTTTAPLLCALYVAWLVHGSARTRRLVHASLCAVVVLTVPVNIKFGLRVGAHRRAVYSRIERAMKSHSTISAIVKTACPVLLPNRPFVETSFRMLRDARIGRFGSLVDDRVAAAPNGSSAIR